MAPPVTPVPIRFRAKVSETKTGCHLWKGKLDRDGYGNFLIKKGTTKKAHAVAFELAYGSFPPGMLVLHKCDNPRCVRPSHLWLGTHIDNQKDKVTKGRQAKGERSAPSKLTANKVYAIRKSKLRQIELANIYKVSQAAISAVLTRKTWKHI